MTRAKFLLLASLGAASAPALAADEATDIVVKGEAIGPRDRAYSATTIDQWDIRTQAVSDVDELFRAVPGMSVRDFGLGGVASGIVIRGFGNGGHGGDLGAVIDGIPLNEAMSHADGYVDFNLVIPLEIEGLTVFHGPVSALYGNYNRGGLVNIQTRKGGDYADLSAVGGSFATADLQAAIGTGIGPNQQLNVAGQLFLSGGFRPQSDLERQTFAARWSIDATPDLHIALSTRLHRARADSASYLTAAQFATDPRGIDPNVSRDGADKNFGSYRADVSFGLGGGARLLTFAYLTRQNFTRWFTRPVSATAWRQREESYDRDIAGAGTSLNGELDAGTDAPIRYVLGVEAFRERTDFAFYDGVVDRVRQGPALNDRRTRLNSVSAFTEVVAPVHRLFDLSLGLRADRFTGGCRLLGPETGTDPCGRLDRTGELSPKIGARSRITDWFELRGSWAEGFALPNNFVKYAIGGQALDANVFRQTEAGALLKPIPGLSVDLALFRMTSSDEVRTLAPGIYENFGATVRKGIEGSVDYAAGDRLQLRATYSYTDTRVRKNADPRLIGKEVAGVPRHSANADLRWSPVDRVELDANWRLIGSYAVDALNMLRSRAYDTVDMGIAYRGAAPFAYRAFLRAENVTDATFATSVSIIGGQTVLAPGSPRAVRAGVQIRL